MADPASRVPQRRLLCIAEAVTLAHVARTHILAQTAAGQGWQVIYCTHPRYNHLFGDEARSWQQVYTIPEENFTRAIDKGKPIYDEDTLCRYVEQDLDLIRTHAPDVVVGDFRLSLSVSARISSVPYVTITNAYWGPYATVRYLVPDIPLTRWVGARLAQRAFDLVRPVAFALHAIPLNRVRRRYGLPALKYDLRYAYTDADLTLYADLEEVVPVTSLPQRHRFIGPLLWAPQVPLPAWWDTLPAERPIVYVNLGSSGRSQLLPLIIAALSGLPVTALVATAGLPLPAAVPANVRLAPYLPGDRVAQRSDLVISNGGSPGCYQALAAGRPVIGVPNNLDQFLNMSLVERCGAGLLLRPEKLNIQSVRSAVRAALDNAPMRERARLLSERIQSMQPPQTAMREIERLLS